MKKVVTSKVLTRMKMTILKVLLPKYHNQQPTMKKQPAMIRKIQKNLLFKKKIRKKLIMMKMKKSMLRVMMRNPPPKVKADRSSISKYPK